VWQSMTGGKSRLACCRSPAGDKGLVRAQATLDFILLHRDVLVYRDIDLLAFLTWSSSPNRHGSSQFHCESVRRVLISYAMPRAASASADILEAIEYSHAFPHLVRGHRLTGVYCDSVWCYVACAWASRGVFGASRR
jgi:hypothetical protein